ncbi:hypothetical protein BDZ90DRAFT_279470 [Jaminaea rosea]|uniref:Uncharacterized protein n=1 Tax=Jaminaea rosea TaxID=1569628 RepID=A0A316UTK6_9BASI|nr:hypothetical protein BDZ90DRAFT_279470 [Jaminaea rosea]PWN27691.1 hypothetical protein BDZ90DRAFT_279470 [Jaminaea rosea]
MPAALSGHPSLTPPTVLGSYGLPPGRAGDSLLQTSAASSSRLSHAAIGEAVKISSGTVRRARGLFATIVAGNAVTLYDAANLTPVQSFTLSPTAQPCTPPLVTLQSISKTATLRTTYVGVTSSTGQGCELWAWSERLETRAKQSASANKVVVSLAEPVASLHALASGDILARNSNGQFGMISRTTPLDAEPSQFAVFALQGEAIQSQASSSSHSVVHSLSILDSAAAAQMMANGGSLGENAVAVVVAVTSAGHSEGASSNTAKDAKKSRRRKSAMEVIDAAESSKSSRDAIAPVGELLITASIISKTDAGQAVKELGTAALAGQSAASIIDLHLYHDGKLSMLTRHGDIKLCQLSIGASGVSITPTRTTLLAHISPAPFPSRPAAVIRLSSSHLLILLHAVSGPSSGKLAALIWDTELDAVLVASDFPMLAAAGLTDDEQRIAISLARVGGSQVVVNVSYWGHTPTQEAVLSVFWALPFFIPEGSVLRHALGKGPLTKTWLRETESAAMPASKKEEGSATGLLPSQSDLLVKMQKLSSQVNEAAYTEMDILFTAWLAEEQERLRLAWEQEQAKRAQDEADEAAAANGGADEDSESEGEKAADEGGEAQRQAASASRKSNRDSPPKPQLSYSFVKALLDVALPPAKSGTSSSYARKIVSYLVERRTLSCGMFTGTEQSLIGRLRARNDWQQIVAVLRMVSDVSESELVSLLIEVLKSQRAGSNGSEGVEAKPSLESFLSLFLSLSVSRPLLRSTLHGRITQVDDVVSLIQVVTTWLQERAVEPLDLNALLVELPQSSSGKLSKNQRKRLGKEGRVKVPATPDLIQFAMDLIDVYFPLLLNSPSSLPALRALEKPLAVHLGTCEQLSLLRGPLDAFARVEADRKLAAEYEATVRHAQQQQRHRDPRIARRAAAEGGVEEKSQTGGGATVAGAMKSARLQALENSALVGPYSVETLEV